MRRAFTLLEVLITVTILCVLISLAMVAGRMAVDSARSLTCAGALRQMSAAIHAYAQDWNGMLVRQTTHDPRPPHNESRWFLTLAPYLDAQRTTTHSGLQKETTVMWGCPVWNRDRAKKTSSNTKFSGYGYAAIQNLPEANRFHSDFSSATARDGRIVELTHPATRIIIGESKVSGLEANTNTGAPLWFGSERRPDQISGLESADPRRHRGHANYGYVDGHVKSHGPVRSALGYLDPANWDG